MVKFIRYVNIFLSFKVICFSNFLVILVLYYYLNYIICFWLSNFHLLVTLNQLVHLPAWECPTKEVLILTKHFVSFIISIHLAVYTLQSSVFQPRFRGTHRFRQLFTGYARIIILVLFLVSRFRQKFNNVSKVPRL
jgi:hypothetical protein